MSQVIIVSTRLPVSVSKKDGKLSFSPSIGGLATGLSSYVSDKQNTWIGWPGISSDELTKQDKQDIVAELAKHNCNPVFLTKRQIDDFYNGYSNDVLWPIFHKLPYSKRSATKHKQWWQSYRSVNQLFSDTASSLARPRSQIWVHDYQLMLVPEMLRREVNNSSIGFFLHIPFPDSKALSKLPERSKLLQGVLGSDLAGFHTPSYVADFLQNCQDSEIGLVGADQVITEDHAVKVTNFPMGIDYRKYADARKSKAVKEATKRYRKRYRGKKVIVAVDRMDPSKGLVERLHAYRELLVTKPKLQNKVVFALIAAPSRTEIAAYKNLALKLDSVVAEINQTFGSEKWQPVDFMNTSQPFEEVSALFSVAAVSFKKKLRDGMNLAAKEFVASNRKRGVLILSETAGAAEELHDALIVDPKKPSTLVDALQEALDMPRRELRGRLRRMQTQLSNNTVQNWAINFVTTLQKPVPGTRPRTLTVKTKQSAEIVKKYNNSKKRLLLLDYDGSLVPFSSNYGSAKPPKTVRDILLALHSDKRNDTVLISGRSADDLQKWFGDIGIGIIAEHGASWKYSGQKKWSTNERAETRWKTVLQPTLEKYAGLTPGARVEVKPHSLVWHYRDSPPYYAQKYAVIIKRALKPIVNTYGLKVFQGNKILEIKNPHINKGSAVQPLLKNHHDFVLAIGDDFTDEELFKALPEGAITLKVGRGATWASYRLHDVTDVISTLKRLLK